MRSRFKWIIALGVLAFAGLAFLLSPFFYISEVVVYGCEKIAVDEIIMKTGINDASNMFLFNDSAARTRILENRYIDSVTFAKTLPGTLSVTVKERRLSGYVEYMQDRYLYIDETGRVLEINSYFTEALPVIGGLQYKTVRLGDILDVENPAVFKQVVTYAQLMNKYKITDKVSRIDVTDSENIRIMIFHIDFNVGDGKYADEKIRSIIEMLDNLPDAENIKGFVDITEIKEQYYFKILV